MLSEALRLIRVFNDIKQQELADKLGLSASYISEIENSKKIPTLEIIEKYSKLFDIPVSSIMFFSEELENKKISSRAKSVISKKIIQFLQLIEERTNNGTK